MKMRVVDQLHISALGPDTMPKGTEFEVSDDLGASLAKRGIAERVDSASPEKSEPPPANKANPPPANKDGEGAPESTQEQPDRGGKPASGRRDAKRR